jgi:hypothetical protein
MIMSRPNINARLNDLFETYKEGGYSQYASRSPTPAFADRLRERSLGSIFSLARQAGA